MLRAVDTSCRTDTGRARRDNEDNAYARAPLFVVADGMGGAQAGEVASAMAVEEFRRPLRDDGPPEERLAERVHEANRRIYETSRITHEHAGMGTTLTAAYLDDADLAVAHVGDSRAYVFRGEELTRLTQDHSLVEELVRRGKLTEAQAAEHPQRSIITRALGIENDVLVDTWTYPMRPADVVLLCSDGLTSMIGEDQILAILARESAMDRAAEALIAAANEAGGRDNITVVLFRIEDVGDGARDTEATQVSMPAVGGDADARGAVATAPPPAAVPRTTASTLPSRREAQRPRPAPSAPKRRGEGRWFKPIVALISTVIVVFLVGGGGYLATRELFFVGTNPDGIVTVYRGLPYDGPFGLHLYEQVYVSGLPVGLVPADRRPTLLDHDLRSQTSAIALVRSAELGQLSR